MSIYTLIDGTSLVKAEGKNKGNKYTKRIAKVT